MFSPLQTCRLLIDPPAAGLWLMAVDEALLESTASGGLPTLRFYTWSEPTLSLSLGYFQSHAQRDSHPPSRACPLVRRQTGGGAIVHDRELTYSLALPRSHPLAHDATRLYDAVDEALTRALAELRLEARICSGSNANAAEQPFLCFARRARGDVLLGNDKICGSAQRRRRGAILQHGSLLLARSVCAPELPGIEQLAGHRPQPTTLIALWQRQLAAALGVRLEPGELTDPERQAAELLVEAKYANSEWTFRR
jgi:lipoate-protein ligase A